MMVVVMVMMVMVPMMAARQLPMGGSAGRGIGSASRPGDGCLGIVRRQGAKADGGDEGADEFVHRWGIKQQ
jgi:hypothetical protein